MNVARRGDRCRHRRWLAHRNRLARTPRPTATHVARLHPVTIAAIALAADRLAGGTAALERAPATAVDLLLQV